MDIIEKYLRATLVDDGGECWDQGPYGIRLQLASHVIFISTQNLTTVLQNRFSKVPSRLLASERGYQSSQAFRSLISSRNESQVPRVQAQSVQPSVMVQIQIKDSSEVRLNKSSPHTVPQRVKILRVNLEVQRTPVIPRCRA